MKSKLQINLFYVVLIAVAVLTFFVFLPYFQALFLAATFAVVCYPIYKMMLRACFGVSSLAAALSVLIIFIIIVIPLSVVLFFLFQELFSLYTYLLSPTGSITMNSLLGHIQMYSTKLFPSGWVPQTTTASIQTYFGQFYSWVSGHVTSIFTNTLAFLADLFIFVFGLFFFLRDGQKFRDLVVKISPLKDVHDKKILHTMALSMRSVVSGSLFIAVLQGIATALGLTIFHVSSPIIWGVLAMLASLLPGLGTFVVMAFLIIFAFFTHGIWAAVGFFIWSFVVIGSIDNILRPIIYERGINIHPFLILLSVFGGIGFFGPVGFIIGPIVLSLLFALLEFHTDVSSVDSIGQKVDESTVERVSEKA